MSNNDNEMNYTCSIQLSYWWAYRNVSVDWAIAIPAKVHTCHHPPKCNDYYDIWIGLQHSDCMQVRSCRNEYISASVSPTGFKSTHNPHKKRVVGFPNTRNARNDRRYDVSYLGCKIWIDTLTKPTSIYRWFNQMQLNFERTHVNIS